jgi:DNA-directed RNA polymerase subunit RPC12/RpoP
MANEKGKVIDMKPPAQQSPQIQIDPTKLDTVRCTNCDSIFWEEVTMFKEVPAVKSPNGKKSMLPIPVVRCADCGNVSEKFLPKELIPEW